MGWQVPLAAGAAEDGNTELSGNVGLFYRQVLGGSGLAGLNVFGDYQDEGADGSFWRWSLGAEYRTAWADVYANRYFPSAVSHRRLVSGGEAERIAYSAGGYDAEVRVHAPGSDWLEGFAEYSLWEGEHGDGDEEGFRYGFRFSPRTGGAADGFRLEADYDAAGGGLGGRFDYSWTLGEFRRVGGVAAFDPRSHLLSPVERRHAQRVRVRTRDLSWGPAVGRSHLSSGGDGDYSCDFSVIPSGGRLTESSEGWEDLHDDLAEAAFENDYRVVCEKLQAGADPDYPGFKRSGNEERALHYAASSRHDAVEIVTLLISRGGHVDALGLNNETALHRAVDSGSFHVAAYLLEQEADVNNKSNNGDADIQRTPLDDAVEKGDRRMAALLRSYGGECDQLPADDDNYDWCSGVGLTAPLDWIEGVMLYAASGYQGSLPTVSAARSDGHGVSVRYGLFGESADFDFDGAVQVLETSGEGLSGSGSLYSVTLWAEGRHDNLQPLTLYATAVVSVLSDISRTVTASPYADYSSGGGLITLSGLWGDLPGTLSYEKAGGAEELALATGDAGGFLNWSGEAGVSATLGGRYEISARVSAPWLSGSVSFSAEVEAGCAAGGEYGEVALGADIFNIAGSSNLNEMCRLIGRQGSEIVNSRDEFGTPLHYAASSHNGGDMSALLIFYGADVLAQNGSGRAPLDWAVGSNAPAWSRDANVQILREAGGLCVAQDHEDCGLRFLPRLSRMFPASVTVSHGLSGGLWTVTVGTAEEAPEVSYRLLSEDSRLSVSGWTLAADQGFVMSSETPLLGGESLSASVVLWAGLQTLSASLAVTVSYGEIGPLSQAGQVFTVAGDYRGDVFTVSAPAEATGVTLSYASSAEEGDVGLFLLSDSSAAAWRWQGDADVVARRSATVLVTLSGRHYQSRAEHIAVTIAALGRIGTGGRSVTVSPYAEGSWLTLSSPGLSGIAHEFVEESGSGGLTLGSDGAVGWDSSATIRAGSGYYVKGRAAGVGALGDLGFSVTVVAGCSADALYGDGIGSGEAESVFTRALRGEDEREVAAQVCRHLSLGGTPVDQRLSGNQSEAHPLHMAARRNRAEAARLLLDLGADPEAQDKDARRPLHWAARYSGWRVAELLLSPEWGADANARAERGDAPLHLARNKTLVSVFVSSEAPVSLNLANDGGESPLDVAVNSDRRQVANALRAGGGVCLLQDHEEGLESWCGLRFWPRTAMATVAFGESKDLHTIVATAAAVFNFSVAEYSFITATWTSGTDAFGDATAEAVLRAENPDELGEMETLVTVSAGAQTLVMTLTVSVVLAEGDLELAAHPSEVTTAAGAEGYMGVVATLSATAEGVTVSYRSGLDEERFALATLSSGKAALSLISPLGGENAVATAVVELGKHGHVTATVIALVTVLGLLPVQELFTILSDRADTGVTLVARHGGTRYEKTGGSDELSVSDSGVISATEESGLSNFVWYHLKARADSPGILGGERFIVSLLASPCAPGAPPASDEAGDLIEAVNNREIDSDGVCRMILAGADVNMKNRNDATPLHRAVVGDDYASASLLIDAGAEVDAQNKKGKTPLYLAASLELAGMVSLLLSAGADGGLPDKSGITPLDMAVENDLDVVADIRNAGGVCLTRTDAACGLIMRPLHSTVVVAENHVGAALVVTATTNSDAVPVYSLVDEIAGFSFDSGTLTADSGTLAEGLVATVSIQAATEGGTQTVAVERVVSVSAPTLAGVLSDYPSRLTAVAGYAGALATLSATEEGVTMFYRSGLNAERFALATLSSGKAELSLILPLDRGETLAARAVVELGKHGHVSVMVTALVTVAALGPFDPVEKEIDADHWGTIHQFTLFGFESALFSATEGSSQDFEVSSDGAVSRKEDVILEGETVYTAVVQAEDEGFLGAALLTLDVSVSVHGKESMNAEFSVARYRAAVAGGYEGVVLTLSAVDEGVSLSYLDGLGENSPFALVSLSSGDYALSLGTAVSGLDVAVLEPRFVFRKTGFYPVAGTADIRVTILGPYSDSAVIQHNATSVAYRFVVPGFAGATFEEVEGSGSNDGFYSVSSADGAISWSLSLTASVSHTIVVRGRDDGFLGDALFTLALSVSFCKADMERATEDDVAALNSKLLQAAKDGDAGLVCELLQQGADVGAMDGSWAPLHWAAYYGHLEVVKYLLSRDDVDADVRNNYDGYTPLVFAAQRGHLEVVKYLLSRDDVDADAQNNYFGHTPLHWAASYGRLDVVKYLLSHDDVDANARGNGGHTPLHSAARRGHLEVVKYLLSRDDVDADAQDNWGRTPLGRVVSYRVLDMAALLRARGGVCLTRTDEECGLIMRPLHSTLTINANHSGAVHTVTAMDPLRPNAATIYSLVHNGGLLGGLSLTVNSETGVLSLPADSGVLAAGLVATVSIQAATEGGTQSVTVEVVIEVFAASGDNVGRHVRTEFSAGRYYAAVAGGYEGVVLTLSAADERVSLSYSGGLEDVSPFSLVSLSSRDYALSLRAAASGSDVVDLEPRFVFRKTGFYPAAGTPDIRVTILGPYSDSAVIQHNATSVAYRFVVPGFAGATFEEVEGSGSNDGFYSVSSADGTISWSLSLTAGVSHMIVVRGKHDGFLGDALFTLALSVSFCKANMERESEDDTATLNSKLLQAAGDGDAGLVCNLLQQGANVEAWDIFGDTPLHRAAVRGHLEVVKYLLSRDDVDANMRNRGNNTPLHEAAYYGRLDVVKYLLSRDDVDANARDGGGDTPLHDAARSGHLDVVKYFLSRDGVDVAPPDGGDGHTPLHEAARSGHLDVVKYLSSRDDVDADARDVVGQTSLHHAAVYGHFNLNVVKYLLSRNDVDVNALDIWGQTPLHYAARYGHLEMVKSLLSRNDVDCERVGYLGQDAASLCGAEWSFGGGEIFVVPR